MAADERALGDLHTKVATVLSELLDGQEIPCEEGEEPMKLPPSAAIITSAIQFLKNNNITCAPSKDNAMGELEAKMAARRAKRATAADISIAQDDMRFMAGMPLN